MPMLHRSLSDGKSQRYVVLRRLLTCLFIGSCVVWLMLTRTEEEEQQRGSETVPADTTMTPTSQGQVIVIPIPNPVCCSNEFQCQAQSTTTSVLPRNVEMSLKEQMDWYDGPSRELHRGNLSWYMDNFRDSEYDHWGHTYEELKKSMYQWKSMHYTSLKSGDRIYESACGIGMNAFMTLEILNEVAGIQEIEFYGNEYARDSVIVAHCIAGSGRLPGKGRLGAICQADSSDLTFGPANFFHLVFTGYISPLFDPLNLGGSTEENFETYNAYCRSLSEGDQQSKAVEAQRIQEDWYAKWVEEMIRLAKPGAPIIVEQVSHPFCESIFDWGGVEKDFWKRAAKDRKWPIDTKSIVMEDDKLFSKRYHVAMRKRKTKP